MRVFLSPEVSASRVLDAGGVAGASVVLGVSGGVDSVCLLHLLAGLASDRGLTLYVVHVHHGIRGADADADAAFVEAEARRLGLPFTLRRVDVPRVAQAPGVSLEEAARQWRYALLAQEAERLGARWVAVAHNADDQVETVLMHVLRGAGLAGLRGMRPITWYGHLRLPLVPPSERPHTRDLWLVRPLLYTLRRDIEAWVAARGLTFRFDRSNLDTTYFRNRLRHEVLPLLESVNPQVRQALFATAELAAADFQVLHPLARSAWAATLRESGAGWLRFDLAGWRALPLALRRAVLRDAVMHLRRELRDVGFRQVERARAFLEDRTMPAGSECTLAAGLVVLREYETFLVGEAKGAADAWQAPQLERVISIPGPGTYDLGHGWQLRVEVLPRTTVGEEWRRNPDRWTAYMDADAVAWPLVVRSRQVGERMEPLGMPGKHVLISEIMVNARVPRWARERWPRVVDASGRVLWLAGVRQAEAGKITDRTERVAVLRVLRAGAAEGGAPPSGTGPT